MSKMQRAGLTGAPADAALLTGVSAVHAGVIQAALENGNPSYAASYMDQARAKGEMSADDILKLQGHLNQQVWTGLANTQSRRLPPWRCPPWRPPASTR